MSLQRRPLFAGNWKMNGLRATAIPLADELASKIRNASPVPFDMLICPPATLIGAINGVVAAMQNIAKIKGVNRFIILI